MIKILDNLRIEAKVLFWSVQICTEPERCYHLSKLLAQSINWDYLLRVAERNGIIPLLYCALDKLEKENLPANYLAELRQILTRNTQQSLLLTQMWFQLQAIFTANNIPVILYKGPALAQMAYGDIALRQFGDIDFLVSPRDFKRANEALVNNDFFPTPSYPKVSDSFIIKSYNEWAFHHKNIPSLIELHWNVFHPWVSVNINTDELLGRKKQIKINGKDAYTLATEDLILILCIHGGMHFWERLEWISDVARLIAITKEIDWEYIYNLSAKLGTQRMLYLGVSLAADLFQVEIPAILTWGIENDTLMRKLGDDIALSLFAEDEQRHNVWRNLMTQLRLRDYWKDKAILFFRYMIITNVIDVPDSRLPDWLISIYVAIKRQLRLSKKHGLRILRG